MSKLRRLKIKEVTLCTNGANQLSDIVLHKSLDNEETMDLTKIADIVLRKAIEDELKRLQTELDLSKQETLAKVAEITKLADEIAVAKAIPSNTPDPAAALPEPLRKMLEDERTARVNIEKELREMRSREEISKMVTQITSDYPHIPGDRSVLAKSLVRMTPEDRANVETILKGTNELLAKSTNIMRETLGTSSVNAGGSEDDPHTKFEVLVKSTLAKNKDMTYLQAFEEVKMNNRELALQVVG